MSNITAESVKKLREMTGAGMMDCKSALAEANGDFDAAIEVLRKKGLKDLAKRAGRTAAEGTIGTYVHGAGQIVAIVELNCETDFVSKGQDFKDLARDIAMQIAAVKPLYVSREEVPANILEKEDEIVKATLTEAQLKSADKILQGKRESFFKEFCLLDQASVKDDKVTIKAMIETLSAKCGEKIVVRRFTRMEVGEGIEKRESNLADDVAATITETRAV